MYRKGRWSCGGTTGRFQWALVAAALSPYWLTLRKNDSLVRFLDLPAKPIAATPNASQRAAVGVRRNSGPYPAFYWGFCLRHTLGPCGGAAGQENPPACISVPFPDSRSRAVLQVSAADLVIGAAAGEGDKHHYVPVFYTKEWAGPDSRVCEYSRPFREVKPKRVNPDGTGYVRGLYTVPLNDPRLSEFIERKFLQVTDDRASRVLQTLKLRKQIEWTSETRSAWSRFIVSLLIRNPEYIRRLALDVVGFFDPGNDEVKEGYRAIRRPEDPETLAEHMAQAGNPAGQASAVAVQRIVDSPRMGGHLNSMRWSVVWFGGARRTLLTSDRPIIMTNGLVGSEGHLALPMGPRMLFVAANTDRMVHDIRSGDPRRLVEHVNDRVVSQAVKYVWGVDDSQLRFVENRLGRMEPSTPLDTAPSKAKGS
jgi:Protein of unknown function (DUF4238)